MKFLISIIMVLLMINLFAQAQDALDQAIAGQETAIAKPIADGDIVREVKDGDAMANTMGLGKSPTDLEGTIPPCLYKDGLGRCVPMPTFSSITSSYGVGNKAGIAESKAKATQQGKQTK